MMMTTAPGHEQAVRIAQTLLDERLAACVQMSDIRAMYRWQGAVASDNEVLLLVKTREDLVDSASERILQMHSYETPEITVVPIVGGSKDYLEWIDIETNQE